VTTKKHFAKDLIEHACAQLVKRARQHVKTGVRPATAARLAIRETQTLFPYDWRLAVQGNDADDHVEVWEAAHKRSSPIASISVGARSHSTKRKRWNHGDVARAHGTSEDVVRRIYAAVQTAKKQGLYGGHTADLIERQLGRRLMGREYTVSALAHEHLQHKPLSGYGGPAPRGSARLSPRANPDDPRIQEAGQLAAQANRVIHEVRSRRDPWADWSSKDRGLLRQAADDLDVAADLYEEAGVNIRAGSLHERARHARSGDDAKLAAYESV